ncbi:MAG: ABC transporter permease [Planctomycetota bacterium]
MSNGRDDRSTTRRLLRYAAPLGVAVAALAAWEIGVRVGEIPEYLLPTPGAVLQALRDNFETLGPAWLLTIRTMLTALAAAVVGGVLLAVLFAVSPLVENSLSPFAVILQVTPLIAIAPLINAWLGEQPWVVLFLCAWIVAFFPILANTLVGLRSADPGLRDLMQLYGATPWQRVRYLLAPSALPFFLAGLRVSANLSLVGAVVAEFAVGVVGSQTGLASTILESSYRLDVKQMFAALALISLTGVTMYATVHLLSQWLLSGWHESDDSRRG